VVCPDFHWVLGSLQKVSPLLQCTNDSEHLFVMDLVVPFHQRQGFAVESHWLPLLFSEESLGEDGSGGKVRTVGLNAKGF